jgi:tetratricopeptide (TPR) repeat protein
MKKYLFIVALTLTGCTQGPQTVQNNNADSAAVRSHDRPMRSEQMQDSRVHTTENQPPVQSTGGKWTQSGDPIDTKEFDANIAAAEKALKSKPGDPAAKKAVADAYFERGVALTNARQYASALGDYRRVLKQQPDHAEAKEWIDQIIGIYAMLKKQYPNEGEEPPPLEFKGEKTAK